MIRTKRKATLRPKVSSYFPYIIFFVVASLILLDGINNNISAQTFTGDLILQKNGKVVLSGAFTVRITEKEISIKHPTTYLVTEVTSDGDMIEWRRIITDINTVIIN